MSEDQQQAPRPDLWWSETTTPGLAVQIDVNQPGQRDPAEDQPSPAEIIDNNTELHAMQETFADVRAHTNMTELHDFMFQTREVSSAERARRLNLMAQELEVTAAYIRKLLREGES